MPTADDCAWLLRFKVSRGDILKQSAEIRVEHAAEALVVGKVLRAESLAVALALIEEHGFKTVVMPPFGEAASVVAECKSFLERVPGVEWMRIVCPDEGSYDDYLEALQEHVPD